MHKDEKAIRAVVATLIRGLETNDLSLIETVYSHDPELLVFLEGPKMKLVGWEAMRKGMSNFLRDHKKIQSQLNDDCRYVISNEVGFFYGTFRFRAVNKKTGKALRFVARNTFIFRKIRGQWRVIHEHDSFPSPTP